MNKKILFITSENSSTGGGAAIVNRNKSVLLDIFGDNNVSVLHLSKPTSYDLSMIRDRILYHYIDNLNKNNIEDICKKTKGFDIVWIDGSFRGVWAKKMKEYGYNGVIVTFFHNIEKYFQRRNLLQTILYPFFKGPIVKSELDAIFNSDHIVTLTERDAKYVYKNNPSAKVTIMPSSLRDSFVDTDGYSQSTIVCKDSLDILFVGSYFYANVNGIIWFIENVLYHVNAKLTIVGNNMEKLPYSNNEKLEIHGFVDDLGEYYRQSDIVVAPIFEGSGMKTKTTEALMWGKYIVGTDEAFCGFCIDETCGNRCQSSDDFINAINNIAKQGISKFNYPSRQLFIERYSMASSIQIVKKMLSV